MERKGWPEEDEFVVCTVKKVMDFGAMAELDEYGKKEGLIHISEVASGWVKYIRDHVREGQKIVCKVLHVRPHKLQIDLSLKDVNEHQRRDKIQEWKNEQKSEKWINYIAETAKLTPEQLDALIEQLYDTFGTTFAAFEEARVKGNTALITEGIDKKIADLITKVANDNLKIPFVEISGFIDITCTKPNGIEIIKKALGAGAKVKGKPKDAKIDIGYIGAPRYRVHIIAADYKTAENLLKKSSQQILKVVQKEGCTAEFHRHSK